MAFEATSSMYDAMGLPGYAAATQRFNGEDPNAPGLASTVFNEYANPTRPLNTWKNLQTGSMFMNYAMSKKGRERFVALASGRGFEWSGMVGFRRAMLGQEAFQGMGFSPLGAQVQAFLKYTGKTEALEKFKKGGFFGKGGLYPEKGPGWVRRLVGGGLVESSVIERDINKLLGQPMKYGTISRGFKEYQESLNSILKSKRAAMSTIFRVGETNKKVKSLIEGLDKTEASLVRKEMSKAAAFRVAGALGKGVSVAAWASLVWDVSNIAGSTLVNAGGLLSEKIENQLSTLGNRQLDFGGNISQGFMSGRSATERQRAIQAMSGMGIRGKAVSGNEASMMHQGSTW